MKTSKWWPTFQVGHNFVPEWHVAPIRLGLRNGKKHNGGRGGSDFKLHFTFHRKTLILKIIIKDRNEHMHDAWWKVSAPYRAHQPRNNWSISSDKARMDFRFHAVPVFPVRNGEVVTRATNTCTQCCVTLGTGAGRGSPVQGFSAGLACACSGA